MGIAAKPIPVQGRSRAVSYLHVVTLLIATLAMGALASVATAIALRIVRFWQTGVPLGARLVPGATLSPVAGVLCATVAAASLAMLAWSYVRLATRLERRPIAVFERYRAMPRLVLGVLLGGLLISLSLGVMIVLDAASITRADQLLFSSSTIIPVLVAPVLEEIIFRGTILRIVEERHGTAVGVILSSALFGMAHLLNDNATVLAALFVAVDLGMLLAMAYVATRSLWLPIGIHAGWNFVEGDIFGAADSGNVVHGLFRTTATGHPLVTGGAFGPEASVVTVVLSAAVAGLFYRHMRKHGRRSISTTTG